MELSCRFKSLLIRDVVFDWILSTFAEAQSFFDDLIAVGANVEIQFDYALFKKQMTKVQLSIGVIVLFISTVTKSILLFILCLLFIVYLSIELRASDEV
jgi:hypothetical protein